MKKPLAHVLSFLPALLAITVFAPAANAQDSIKLKVTHPLPATHYLVVQGIKKVTDAVTERTNGRVQFEVYPASQLGADHFTALKSGLADIGFLVTSYYPDKFPMSPVTELPGLYSSSCEATSKSAELAKPGGILQKLEYGPRGIQPFVVSTIAPYNLSTASKKIETLDDLAGQRIWASGGAMDKIIRSLGGVPVKMVASELFDSVSRGTIDGLYMNYLGVTQYKLETKIRHTVQGAIQFGSGTFLIAMNDKSWAALPQSVRDVFVSVGAEVQTSLCKYMDAEADRSFKQVVAAGVTTTTLSPEQVKLWNSKLGKVADEWAAEMDAGGRSGSDLLNAMRKAPGTPAK